MHEAGHPKLVLWGNPEGRGGEGAASRVQGQGIHVYLRLIRDEGGQKTPQCCQVIVLQLNKLIKKNTNKQTRNSLGDNLTLFKDGEIESQGEKA